MSRITERFGEFATQLNTYYTVKYQQGIYDLSCECATLDEVEKLLEDLYLDADVTITGIDILTEHDIDMDDFEESIEKIRKKG